jgi:hypothetical protein
MIFRLQCLRQLQLMQSDVTSQAHNAMTMI